MLGAGAIVFIIPFIFLSPGKALILAIAAVLLKRHVLGFIFQLQPLDGMDN